MGYNQAKNPLLKKLGNRIQKIRKEKGLTREEFIKKAELSKYYFYRVEFGNANPSILQLKKIADALEVQIVDLLDVGE